jgi:predicted dehydrogenase
MTRPEVSLLDEWRREGRDVRVAVTSLVHLADVSEQYVSPPRSARLIWTYIRRFGIWTTLLKVHSRLSERDRNRKFSSFGVGVVTDCPTDFEGGTGQLVWFFAPSCASDAKQIVVDRSFVCSTAFPKDADLAASLRLPEQLQPYAAWSSFSGVVLDEQRIAAGLLDLVSQLGFDQALKSPVRSSFPTPAASACQLVHDQSTTKPRAVIFGMGNYAKQIIVPNVPRGFELAAVHEIDPLQLAGWGRRDVSMDTSPWPRADERYDLWFVAGYHCTHAQIALTGLERGGAVAVEKPLATTMEDVLALRSVLEERPEARLFACFQRRYAKYNEWIKEDLQAAAGDPIQYNCIVYEIPLSPIHWYSWPSSRGRLISNGCHWIDHFMMLNGYSNIVSSEVIPAAQNGSVVFIALENGAEFTMRLTEIGSPRIGVRDYVECALGSRTVTVRDSQFYCAQDGERILREKQINGIDAYRDMYVEICRRVLAGEPGDSVASLKSSVATILLDERLQALTSTKSERAMESSTEA